MTEVNAVVVFYSRYGQTERLALAAGVGAVQARANIRLRRLKDLADAETIARDTIWSENLARMASEYIAPRDIDSIWADVILVASCPHSLRETEEYLKALQASPAKKDSLQIVMVADDPVDRLASARAHGRTAIDTARARKT